MTSKVSDVMQWTKSSVPYPIHYQSYIEGLLNQTFADLHRSTSARSEGWDPSTSVETTIAIDLADRVQGLLGLNAADRIRDLLSTRMTEVAALEIAEEVALGRFGFQDRETLLNLGVRVGLAVVTDGVTVAPLQGISSVSIKKNDNGSQYASVSFAGPIRSAGGTEAAFTLVIADRLRMTMGLERYRPTSDEVGRYVEELRVYEREVGNFQYRVSDNDVRTAILNLPVEIDGVETDPVEVVVHRGLDRVGTDRVRGGALRVLNDGVIGRSRKLLNLVSELSIPNWDWLGQISSVGAVVDETRAEASHFKEVISGRPVLCFPGRRGAFRLRYGRACNTGLSTVGFHPAVAAILDWPIVPGTQVKLDVPGKAATVAWTDSLDPPVVKLMNGSVVNVSSTDEADSLRSSVQSVLHLGDILVNFGDFLENNIRLQPSGYVEEWWSEEVKRTLEFHGKNYFTYIEQLGINPKRLTEILENSLQVKPTSAEAWVISEKLKVPLHPKHLYFWDLLSPREILLLRDVFPAVTSDNGFSIRYRNDLQIKEILETLCIEHSIEDGFLVLKGDAVHNISKTLALGKPLVDFSGWKDVNEYLSMICGVKIMRKSSTLVGVRVGRPEKAMMRSMKPPVHVLFPVGLKGGLMRDLIAASSNGSVEVELVNYICRSCGSNSTRLKCDICGSETRIEKRCPSCGRPIEEGRCSVCKVGALQYVKTNFPLKEALRSAIKNVDYNPEPPLKGVKALTNSTKIPEALEKGLLRRKHDVSVYKDGTIRFDVTNAPLTHFTPAQLRISIDRLKELGYLFDKDGQPLVSDSQVVELFIQDVILPSEAGDCLLRVSKFLDELLLKLYRQEPAYNASSKEDLIGRLIIGLAPHTSVGIVGRIIGFTPLQVCLAHPYWHSAKRRDCDGDEDAVLLLLDVFLNFSKELLPAQIGGYMDAPLMVQPLVLPREVQRQAHNIDFIERYPLKFYEATCKGVFPKEVISDMDIAKSRLGSESQFYGFGYTHHTGQLYTSRVRSTYSTLQTITEKIEKQIEIATKVIAVTPAEVVTAVLKTHLIPDIIGNISAFTSQSFKCRACGTKFRRIPVKGSCLSCGGKLQQTVTRGSVEKYLYIALNLAERYQIDSYVRRRLELVRQELIDLFKETDAGIQVDLQRFMSKPLAE